MPEARTTIIYKITLCFTWKKYTVHNFETVDIVTYQSGVWIEDELQIDQPVEFKNMNDLSAKVQN
jgi:hypothetical protein